MEKLIIISCNTDQPVQDFIKDEYKVLTAKTADGIEHYHLIKKVDEVAHT